MYHIELDEAKAKMDAVIQTALDGEEVVITQNDEPVLKIVPVSKSTPRRRAGSARGLISMAEDFDEPLEDFAEYTQ